MLQELTTLQKIYESILAYLVGYSFQLFGAAVIILAGLVVAKWASSAALRLQEIGRASCRERVYSSV